MSYSDLKTDQLVSMDGTKLPTPAIVSSLLRTLTDMATANVKYSRIKPYSIDAKSRIDYYQDTLFQCLMAMARDKKVRWVSLSTREIISPRIKNVPSPAFSADMFAWRVVEALGLGGSAGNSMGNDCAQYFINTHQAAYFAARQFGVWDTHTEEQILPFGFTLDFYGTALDKFNKAVELGEFDVNHPLYEELIAMSDRIAREKYQTRRRY